MPGNEYKVLCLELLKEFGVIDNLRHWTVLESISGTVSATAIFCILTLLYVWVTPLYHEHSQHTG